MLQLWRDFNISPRRLGFAMEAVEDHRLGERWFLCVFVCKGLENDHRAAHLLPLLASSCRLARGNSGGHRELEKKSGVRGLPYLCLLFLIVSL